MTPPRVTPGQVVTPQQKIGLELVARLHSGRDVVLAIDLTESVGLNNEGHIRLRQIIEDSLKPGDSVYVVPFASNVALLEGTSDLYPLGSSINFSNNSKNSVEKIIQKIPLSPDSKLQNTDIQPTVQEMCTIAPSGEKPCKVNSYLFGQLCRANASKLF